MSSKPRGEYLQALAGVYGAASTEPEDIAHAVAQDNASLPQSDFERSARAAEVWREAGLDALGE